MNIDKLLEEQLEYYVATIIHNKLENKYVYHKRKYYIKDNKRWKPLDSDYIEFRKDFRNEMNTVKDEILLIIENYVKDLQEIIKNGGEGNAMTRKISIIAGIVDDLKKITTYNRILANCKELFYVSEL